MIKDVMVWVDGSLNDEIRLEAAGSIARQFEGQVIALVLNPTPLAGSIESVAGAAVEAESPQGRRHHRGENCQTSRDAQSTCRDSALRRAGP
jgi:hypothetical protein